MTTNYGLVVRFKLRPDAAEGFDSLVAETVPQISKHEPGTLIYTVHQVAEKPSERIFYELYQDEAAFQAHQEQPHTRRFLDERQQYLDSYEVDFVTPISRKETI